MGHFLSFSSTVIPKEISWGFCYEGREKKVSSSTHTVCFWKKKHSSSNNSIQKKSRFAKATFMHFLKTFFLWLLNWLSSPPPTHLLKLSFKGFKVIFNLPRCRKVDRFFHGPLHNEPSDWSKNGPNDHKSPPKILEWKQSGNDQHPNKCTSLKWKKVWIFISNLCFLLWEFFSLHFPSKMHLCFQAISTRQNCIYSRSLSFER